MRPPGTSDPRHEGSTVFPQQHLLTAPQSSTAGTVTDIQDDGRGEVTLLVRGDVDTAGSPVLARGLDAAWLRTPASLVVDLADARFVNVSSLAVLFRARNRAQEQGVAFRAEGLPAPIRRFMTAMELDLDVPARAAARP